MAFAPSAVYPIREGGAFIEKDHGNLFEYDLHGESLLPEYPHRVWVSENPVNDSGWRYALVKKTVAYIVVDEDESGQPVVQKWSIKAHRIYSN
jgi:hypothetical protein